MMDETGPVRKPGRKGRAVRIILLALAALFAAGEASAQKTFLGVAEAARDAGFEGVLVVGDRNGPVISAVSGQARPGVKHTLDEVWPWASVTKQVTAALVLQEVERGRLSLDSTLSSVLPSFPGSSAGRVTIRQLLQHTSGLPNPEKGSQSPVWRAPAFYLREKAPKRQADDAEGYCAGPPAAEPGARFDYNNCDYIVLGAVLESLDGAAYADLVRTRIAEPLGLESLRTAPRKRPKRRDVVGHDGQTVSPPFNEATYGAAGALFGTAEDLLAFDRALLEGRVVGEAARAEMWKGDPALGYAALGAWAFPARLAGCTEPVALIERRGAVGGVQVRNIIAPERRRMLVAFVNDGAFDFGEIWQGKGWSWEFASAAFCPKNRPSP